MAWVASPADLAMPAVIGREAKGPAAVAGDLPAMAAARPDAMDCRAAKTARRVARSRNFA